METLFFHLQVFRLFSDPLEFLFWKRAMQAENSKTGENFFCF